MDNSIQHNDLLSLTADIVSAHVSNNDVSTEELPNLVHRIYATLTSIDEKASLATASLTPVVPIEESIQPDYIVCLEDGRKLQMLKRHLRKAYGLTPEQYRQRWNLSPDYPMVAPNYSKKRSSLAKDFGLGVRKKTSSAA